jgi:curli biogenesis system outer membrane secretion channel CsgG
LGGLGGAFGLGGLGVTRPKTQVALTARIVDVTTGEIVASMTGAGVSRKGGSILLGGGGGGVGGGIVLTSSEFRASALGEATERAVGQLVERIVARRSAMR